MIIISSSTGGEPAAR
ncbi:unnamed protein product [Linum tenue]|uniref:Uncharacterized protein n=1 Tax=Linum tenue TaxID=586396 RepID=A0AAV0J9F7_9ROSI|nr:unnamed protein product [Linum tenue]